MTSVVWLDGHFLDVGKARIDPADRGFLLGDGAFETMRLRYNTLRRWYRHQARLAAALDMIAIAQPDWEVVQRACLEVARRNGLEEAVVRVTISRGPHGRGFEAPEGEEGTVLITATERPKPPVSVSLVTLDMPRRDAHSLSARFKSLGYADALHARRRAKAAGADMAIMLSGEGDPASADCGNLFWLTAGELFTPGLETGAMPGVTRAAILELAAADGLRVHQHGLRRSDLAQAEAAFVSNAVMGVVAVQRLDGRSLNTTHGVLRRLQSGEARQP